MKHYLWLAILTVLFSRTVQSEPTTAPTALTVIPSRLVAPATVHVQTSVAEGQYVWWDFGDPSGAYNTSAQPFYAHVYDKPGTYRIQLFVYDERGATRLETQEITILPDNRRTIHVASSGSDSNPGTIDKPLQTLSKAAQSLRNDSVILLRRGDKFAESKQITITQSNIRIGAYGGGKDQPLIHFRDADWKTMFLLKEAASDIVIENLNFDLRSKNFAVEMNSSHTTIRECEVAIGGGLLVAKNAPYLLVDHCGNDKPTDRGLLYAGGVNVPNINFIVRRCWSAGSKYEHCLRVHNTRGLLVQDCVFDNSGSAQGKQALNLRDGSDFYVTTSRLIGPCVFGPLADKTGGLYDEPGAERDRKMSLRLNGLNISNCGFGGYTILEAGIINFAIQDTWITAKNGGACFQIQTSYGERQPASGIFRRIGAFYEGGKAVSGPMKDVTLEKISGNVREAEKK